MNDKVNGFVLSASDYKDNDLILQVLTKEYGILSLVAKAGKKLSSRNRFLSYCLYEFIIDYRFGRSIFSIHGHKLLKSCFESDDLILLSFENILSELTLKNREIDTYEQLVSVFGMIERSNMYLLGCLYVSYLIRQFGITPQVDGCTVCGNKKVVSFSNSHGGFLCLNHLGGERIYDVETLKKIRLISKADLSHYDILKQFQFTYGDFAILMEFFMANSDIRIRSYDFYKTLI